MKNERILQKYSALCICLILLSTTIKHRSLTINLNETNDIYPYLLLMKIFSIKASLVDVIGMRIANGIPEIAAIEMERERERERETPYKNHHQAK